MTKPDKKEIWYGHPVSLRAAQARKPPGAITSLGRQCMAYGGGGGRRRSPVNGVSSDSALFRKWTTCVHN